MVRQVERRRCGLPIPNPRIQGLPRVSEQLSIRRKAYLVAEERLHLHLGQSLAACDVKHSMSPPVIRNCHDRPVRAELNIGQVFDAFNRRNKPAVVRVMELDSVQRGDREPLTVSAEPRHDTISGESDGGEDRLVGVGFAGLTASVGLHQHDTRTVGA